MGRRFAELDGLRGIAALAAASLITYFVERPALKWSRRLYRAWQEQQRQETEAQILDDKRSSTVS